MKKIILSIICGIMSFASLCAQEVNNRAAYELNINRSLWYNTSSAAGLALSDMSQWRNVSVGYGLQTGKFTDAWGARTQSSFLLGGDMLMDIEGFKVAADVNLGRDRLFKSKYNNSLYEIAMDMPFFVALNSDEPYNWKRFDAEVNLKAASPLMFDDMLTFGLALNLATKSASKADIPTARYGSFDLEIAPSATVALNDENIVGLTLSYKMVPARSRINEGEDASRVAMLYGLGSYFAKAAGGEYGIGPIKYKSNLYGAKVQYNHMADFADILAEVSIDKGTTTVLDDITEQGSVDKFLVGTTVQGLFSDERNRKLSFDFCYNLSYWMQNAGAVVIGKSNIINAGLDYTVYTDPGDGGFDWTYGAGIDFSSLSQRRYAPDGIITGVSILPYVFAGKNIELSKEESLLVKADFGYNFSVNADYAYGASVATGNYFVNYMYPEQAKYLGRYYMLAKLDASYTYRVNTFFSAYASLGAGWKIPMGVKGSMLAMLLSVGVLF